MDRNFPQNSKNFNEIELSRKCPYFASNLFRNCLAGAVLAGDVMVLDETGDAQKLSEGKLQE